MKPVLTRVAGLEETELRRCQVDCRDCAVDGSPNDVEEGTRATTAAAQLLDIEELRFTGRIVTLEMTIDGDRRTVHADLEQFGPTGSVKYRTAVGLLAELHAARPLDAGTRVIESTSGNLGVALAALLCQLGCQFEAVVDPLIPPELKRRLMELNAKLVVVKKADAQGRYLRSRIDMVHSLCASDGDLRWTNQYASMGNVAVHRATTAKGVMKMCDDGADIVLVAVSTGGTAAGVAAALKSARRTTPVVAVDVDGSIATPGRAHFHLLSGIGATRPSNFLLQFGPRQAIKVTDVDAISRCRLFAEDTGIRMGGSSGAVLVAAESAIRRGSKSPALVCPDGGDAYANTLYSDHWLAQKGVLSQVLASQSAARRSGLRYSIATSIL